MLRPIISRAAPRLFTAARLQPQLFTPLTLARAVHRPRSPNLSARHPPPSPPLRAPEPEHEDPTYEQHHMKFHDRPMPESRESTPGIWIVIAFGLVAVPVSLALNFPSRMLPPVPDPEYLRYLSRRPLTAEVWREHTWDAIQMLGFRMRRGEYYALLREDFTFSPLAYMGIELGNENRRRLLAGKELVETPWRWWTWGTYMFAHAIPMHLAFCLMAMGSLVPMMTLVYGAPRTIALFVGGGVGAAALVCEMEMLKHGKLRSSEVIQVVEFVGEDGQRKFTAMAKPGMQSVITANMGSSSGLMALMTVSAITMPQMKWGVLFLPWQFGARSMLGALVVWDVLGTAGIVPNFGIGHVGHLCGDVVGVLLYVLWLRRLPASRVMKQVRQTMGYR